MSLGKTGERRVARQAGGASAPIEAETAEGEEVSSDNSSINRHTREGGDRRTLASGDAREPRQT
jgi:hypothetical protein